MSKVVSFTHNPRNAAGFEEVVIEYRKSLWSRLICRDHAFTFYKTRNGWRSQYWEPPTPQQYEDIISGLMRLKLVETLE